MFQKTKSFIRRYIAFSIIILLAIIALLLDLSKQDSYAHYLLAIASVITVMPMLKDMYESIRGGEYGVDILAVTAILAAVIAKEYWAAIIIVIMLTGGEVLEDYAETRAKKELTALINNAPKLAHLLNKNGQTSDIDVKKVTINDLLVIRPGEVVPVDSVITEGRSSFDESSLTGESLPAERKVGQEILSGSLNMEGSVTVRALRTSKDSQYETIVKLVESATESKAPFSRLADRYSVPFTIFAYIVAFSAWYAWGDFERFVGVLVVATPCPLLLGAPIGLISGMSRAAKNGIIIKSGTALERLASVKSIAFDKTGTLTTGRLNVSHVYTFGEFDKLQVLEASASIEQKSAHTMATTITTYAQKQGITLYNTKHVSESISSGVVGTMKGKLIRVGKKSFVTETGAILPNYKEIKDIQGTQVWVAIGKEVAGVIVLEDTLRDESRHTLQKIKDLGIKPIRMLTGDNEKTAYQIAKAVGIAHDNVLAECLPSDKLVAVHDTPESQRPIAMVGDGVNDAPVLAASDVGIALGARGSTAASETADVVILEDNLERVATAIWIAKNTFKITRRAILLGIAMSVGLMLFFATTKTKPVIGASLQELVDVTVILYALRAHGPFRKKTKKSTI